MVIVFEVNLNVNMHHNIDLFVKPEMMEIFEAAGGGFGEQSVGLTRN